MTENVQASTSASLPPAPQPVVGNPQYDAPQGNGQGNPSHMPPPPRPPVIIPQNNNPIPTAITSPMSGGAMLSPTSAGGYVRRAAPEPNKRALYVGGLDPRVTEDILKQIFETSGHVLSVKIIPDKNVSSPDTPCILPLPPDLLGGLHHYNICHPSFTLKPLFARERTLIYLLESGTIHHQGPQLWFR